MTFVAQVDVLMSPLGRMKINEGEGRQMVGSKERKPYVRAGIPEEELGRGSEETPRVSRW